MSTAGSYASIINTWDWDGYHTDLGYLNRPVPADVEAC